MSDALDEPVRPIDDRPTDPGLIDGGLIDGGLIDGGPTADPTPWLDAREMAGWRSFIETYADLVGALEADLAGWGLTLGDYQVLVFLSEAPDNSMRMVDLAGVLQLSPSGLTRRLDGLVRAGWVERRNSDADRRVMRAVLTDAGREYLATVAPAHVRSVRIHMLDHLDADDIDALATVFGKLRVALDR